MNEKVESILEQLTDPDQPWVWMPADSEPELWGEIGNAARKAGFGVVDLDGDRDIASFGELLEAFREEADLPGWTGRSLNALKDALTGLPDNGHGWVILYRDPGPLCEEDPESFEGLLDVVEAANDIKASKGRGPLTLVTLDAEEDAEN